MSGVCLDDGDESRCGFFLVRAMLNGVWRGSACGAQGYKMSTLTPGFDAAQGKREDDDLDRWRFASEIVEVMLTTPPDCRLE